MLNKPGDTVKDPRLLGFLASMTKDNLHVTRHYEMEKFIIAAGLAPVVPGAPRSLFMAHKFRGKLNRMYLPPNEKTCDSLDLAAQQFIDGYFYGHHLKALSTRRAAGHLDKTTSAGAFAVGMKKGDVLGQGIIAADEFLRSGLASAMLMQYRTGLDGSVKTICNVPLDVIIAETKFVVPVVELLKEQAFPFTNGWTIDDIGSFLSGFEEGKTVSYDIKSFDANIPRPLIRRIVLAMIDLFPGHRNDIENMLGYLLNGSFIELNGVVTKRQGYTMPSGSAWTNVLDSVASWCLLRAAQIDLEFTVQKQLFCGDDAVIQLMDTPHNQFLYDLEGWFARIGVVMSVEKSHIGKIQFVGYNWKHGMNYMLEDKNIWSMLVYPGSHKIHKEKPAGVVFSRLYGVLSMRHLAWKIRDRYLKSIGKIKLRSIGVNRMYGKFQELSVW